MESSILNRLYMELQRSGTSIYKFAKATGIPKERIYKWKQGKGAPKVEDVELITIWLDDQLDAEIAENSKSLLPKKDSLGTGNQVNKNKEAPKAHTSAADDHAKYVALLEKTVEKDAIVYDLKENVADLKDKMNAMQNLLMKVATGQQYANTREAGQALNIEYVKQKKLGIPDNGGN